MEYKGRYRIFDSNHIETYPIRTRNNKVKLADLLAPTTVSTMNFTIPATTARKIEEIAQVIVELKNTNRPVMLFTGAHLIKNGLGRLLVDLAEKDILLCLRKYGHSHS